MYACMQIMHTCIQRLYTIIYTDHAYVYRHVFPCVKVWAPRQELFAPLPTTHAHVQLCTHMCIHDAHNIYIYTYIKLNIDINMEPIPNFACAVRVDASHAGSSWGLTRLHTRTPQCWCTYGGQGQGECVRGLSSCFYMWCIRKLFAFT